MLEEVDNERCKLSIINKSLEHSYNPLADKVEELNAKWNRIVEALTNRAAEMEKGDSLSNFYKYLGRTLTIIHH